MTDGWRSCWRKQAAVFQNIFEEGQTDENCNLRVVKWQDCIASVRGVKREGWMETFLKWKAMEQVMLLTQELTERMLLKMTLTLLTCGAGKMEELSEDKVKLLDLDRIDSVLSRRISVWFGLSFRWSWARLFFCCFFSRRHLVMEEGGRVELSLEEM